ncbi:cellulose biosynthesis regulator YedQ, partial [Escherichia coli]
LSRADDDLHNELTAALEVGYLLRLSHAPGAAAQQAMYVSRAGFFLSTQPTSNSKDILTRYFDFVTQPWFNEQSERMNKSRGV